MKKLNCLALFFSVLMIALCFSQIQAKERSQPFVVSGVVVNSGSATLVQRFVNYLSDKTGYALHPVYVDTYTELSKIMRDNPHAIAWTCGAPFVEDHINDGQQLISVPLFKQKPEYHSLVITRKNRPEQNLEDFKGQIFTYSDLRSNSGYFSPSMELKKQGHKLEDFFRLNIRAGNHERSIQAIANGLADVAAVDEYVWVEFVKQKPAYKDQIKILKKNGPYPFTPIVAGKSVSKQTIKKFQKALLNFDTGREGQQILKKFGLDGFKTKQVSFYDPIKNMLDAINQ